MSAARQDQRGRPDVTAPPDVPESAARLALQAPWGPQAKEARWDRLVPSDLVDCRANAVNVANVGNEENAATSDPEVYPESVA